MISEYTTAPITARKAYHTVALIESSEIDIFVKYAGKRSYKFRLRNAVPVKQT